VSVKHRKRAWQTKELLRKEPCAKVRMTRSGLAGLVSLQLCSFAGGVICTKIMVAGPTAGQFLLICCTQLYIPDGHN